MGTGRVIMPDGEVRAIIYEDTAQQLGKHENIHEWCKKNGVKIIRTKLTVGDYMLPTGAISVDTKQDMAEVYGNLSGEMKRFQAEYNLADELGIELIILVEDKNVRSIDDVETWRNPIYKASRPSTAIATQMRTIQEHHNLRWEFCKPADTAQRIMELLGGLNG